MNFGAYRALARGVVLESSRRKDLWVVVIVSFLILLAAGGLGIFGSKGLEIFISDLAYSVLSGFGTVITVLTACRMIPDEIRQRTLYPLLARPIRRWEFIFGKYLGALAVSWIGFAILSALVACVLLSFHVTLGVIALQYFLAKLVGLALLCAVGVSLSICCATPAAATTITLVLAFATPLFVRGLVMAGDAGPALRPVYQVINLLLPQFQLFDLGGRAVYIGWSPIPLWIFGFLIVYASIYGCATMFGSWLSFRRRAL